MKMLLVYSVKLQNISVNFTPTVMLYRKMITFYIDICLKEWEDISSYKGKYKNSRIEQLSLTTKHRPIVKYPFPFGNVPVCIRRASIQEALGKVSSYKSNYMNWLNHMIGGKPRTPITGHVFPVLYKSGCFHRLSLYEAEIKLLIHGVWCWVLVRLRKSDIDYINRHCSVYKECSPTLRKRGKNWYLDFPFKLYTALTDKPVLDRVIISVDLGINNACACSIMLPDGTIVGRKFLSLPKEENSLNHKLNKIKKAQQHGARKMPRLWASVKGVNNHIATKTAQFIIDVAHLYHADVIVFEHLNLQGKKKGAKKQRLHHWKARAVQRIVTDKAHRLSMRISTVCAWNTSVLAFDGSGKVIRDKDNYSMCTFQTGKRYNCDLNASYNIGARYFIREILKSLPEKVRLDVQAKVPELSRRTTCTLSTLISLNAELTA